MASSSTIVNREDDEEVNEASHVLFSMSHVRLDSNTARRLEEKKRKLRSTLYHQREHQHQHQHQHAFKIQDFSENPNYSSWPPTFPPIPYDVVGTCSNPFEKRLISKGDAKDDKPRLLIVNKNDAKEFLMPFLNDDKVDRNRGIPVTTYDMHGNDFSMTLKEWESSKNIHKINNYVLTGRGWTRFYETNGLAKINSVTVWMFRHAVIGKLCFVVTWREGNTISDI